MELVAQAFGVCAILIGTVLITTYYMRSQK